MKPTVPTADDVPELRAALLAHYDREARDLPWRRDRDPYRVLVSEIMLQQTRVETVLGYYEPWLARFPTVEDLADASEDEVLKAWEGLGYYRRARNLRRAAIAVRERPEGFPDSAEALRVLPGVGEYTAGAIASIAFEEVTPAVDGNVRRVMARLYDEPDPRPAWLRRRAAELVDPERPGDWNQALMEHGAMVCTPRGPACDVCPVAEWCAAVSAGTVTERPAPKDRKTVPTASFVLAVLEADGRVLVERRSVDGLLGGMWAFPEVRLDGPADESVGEAAREIARGLGFAPLSESRLLEPVAHRFSHLDATYLPAIIEVEEMADGEAAEAVPGEAAETADDEVFGGARGGLELRWIHGDDEETALPVAQRRVLEQWEQVQAMEVS